MKRHIIYIAASVFMLAGCAKTEAPQVAESDTITVFMPEISTKTAFGQEADNTLPLVWKTGDEIAVVQNLGSAAEKVATYVLDGEGGSVQGVFKYKSGAIDVTTITDIVYPASAVSNPVIPTTQTYTVGNFDPKSVVMTWHDANGLGEEGAQLSTEASVLCLMLKSSNAADIKKIKTTLAYADASSVTYTLNCSNLVLSETAIPFYIAVEGSENACDVTFDISHSNATDSQTATGKTFSAYEVSRFPEIDVIAQELSADLPAIGELYEGGVVFDVNNEYVKVISLQESEKLSWSTETISTGCVENHEDGIENTQKLLSLPSYSPATYPAVAWCVSLGDGWYLPSSKELILIRQNLLKTNSKTEDEAAKAAANELMTSLGGDPFSWAMYWSSREHATDNTKANVARLNKDLNDAYKKSNAEGSSGSAGYRARAVKKITIN